MTITREPAPNGRVRLYDDGQFFVECRESQAEQSIEHHINTGLEHFGGIAEQQQIGDPNLVVAIDWRGTLGAYSIGSPADSPKGFGGQRWTIHFHDGRLIYTDSLWFLGDIPRDWMDRIVENATLEVRP